MLAWEVDVAVVGYCFFWCRVVDGDGVFFEVVCAECFC